MPTTPLLKRREDIWTFFPVNSVPLGRGANGADRHGIEWHTMKLRRYAAEKGMSVEQAKADVLPTLLKALATSASWKVEAPAPGSPYIAVLVMRFAKVTNTRRNSNKNAVKRSPNKNTKRSPNKNKVMSKSKSPQTRRSKSPRRNETRKNRVLSGEDLLKKATGIINRVSDKTVQKLAEEFVGLVPATEADFQALLHLMYGMALESQAYHPLFLQILHLMDAKHVQRPYPQQPSRMIAALFETRIRKEPIFLHMEIQTEEGMLEMTNAVENTINKERAYFKSCALFVGFLYREGMLAFPALQEILGYFRGLLQHEDYRFQDTGVQGMIYILIRAGRRLEMEGGESAAFIQSAKEDLRVLAATVGRKMIKTLCLEFLDAAAAGYTVQPEAKWAVGAPLSDIRIAAAPAAAKAAEGLGSDIGELWRRYPLDVKQQGDMWVVRVHNKKMQDRFAKEGGKFASAQALESYIVKKVTELVDHSAHWRRGPVLPGTVMTVVAK